MPNEHETTFRVTNIPESYSSEIFRSQLVEQLGIDESYDFVVHSLASDIDETTTSRPKTATVSFREIPLPLAFVPLNLSDDRSYCLRSGPLSQARGPRLYFDTDFDGFTPLSPTEGDDEYKVDCIVIPGWGGHAFGSFKERGGSFMWLRDEITGLFPRLRVWLYGYNSKLTGETSIESVGDWCHTFCDLLVDLRVKTGADQQKRPLIFIVHSLGGWIFKEAMVSLSRHRDPKAKDVVNYTYGALFFGVPGQGMNTDALATMVGQKPQRATIALLDQGVHHHLRAKQHQEFCDAFDFEHSRIVNFFETSLSETVKFDTERKRWLQNSDRVLLVSPDSATTRRSWDRREDQINLKGTHSTLVKFRPNDRTDYRKVKQKLKELVEEAEDAIRLRISSQGAKPYLDMSKGDSDPYKVLFSLKGLPLTAKFVARDEQMADLRATLLPTSARMTQRKVFVLHGQGGSGKTQLAIEFARTAKGSFSSIFWLNGESVESMRQSFVLAARKLPKGQIPDSYRNLSKASPQEVNEVVNSVLTWFSQDGNNRWLLVYDNVDRDNSPEADDPLSFDLEEFFPEADHGSILVTTRLRNLGQHGIERNIGRMTETQGLGILKSRIDRPVEGLERIVELVGGLPLALAHAGSFIQETATSIGDYIRFYQETWSELFDSNQISRLREYPRSILSTYTISYKHVQSVDMDAATVLDLFAYLDNTDLWYSLFTPLLTGGSIDGGSVPPNLQPEWFRRTFCKELNFTQKMRTLLDYSLLEARYDTSSYAVHPIIHSWCLHVNHRNDGIALLATSTIISACSSIDGSADWTSRKRLSIQLIFISSWFRSYSWRSGDSPEWKYFHNRTFQRLGFFLKDQGKLPEAEAMYQRALHSREKALGPDHTSTLATIGSLGVLYCDQGKFTEAERMYQRALQGYEKALGPNHISTLNTIGNLGVLYSEQGKLVDAEVMQQRALEGKEKVLGPDHASTLDTVGNLGNLYRSQGKLVEAEAMYQRALHGREKALGPDHTSTLGFVNNLGVLYNDQGKLAEAEAMFQRALQGSEKALGPDHTSTLATVGNLGALCWQQGKLAEAEAMYQRVLQGYEEALGPNHMSTLDTIGNLGILYRDQGKLVDAEVMHQRALEGKEKALGPHCISTFDTVTNLGVLYRDQGKLVEAEAMYQRALQSKEKVLGPDHTSTLDIVNNLGLLYNDQGKLTEAEASYQQMIQGYEKVLGPDHTSTLRAISKLATLYHNQGRLIEAEALYQQALQGYDRTLGPEHTSTLRIIGNLATLYNNQDELVEAEALYQQAPQG
ncbi:MAG: hypothetical protein M1814_000933 [Vezdaea aestivalis]|nr:MAG: hypothetical protein M1814_000933 [Vezdaea aestivalis]